MSPPASDRTNDSSRLRAAFLAESRRRLPDVQWRTAEGGALVHPEAALGLVVIFEDGRYTVDYRARGTGWHFDAFDPAPGIPPDEVAEAAAQVVEWIRDLLARADRGRPT